MLLTASPCSGEITVCNAAFDSRHLVAFRRYSRSKSYKLSKIAPNCKLLPLPEMSRRRAPKFWNLVSKARLMSDHVVKFRSDRPRDLKDYALKIYKISISRKKYNGLHLCIVYNKDKSSSRCYSIAWECGTNYKITCGCSFYSILMNLCTVVRGLKVKSSLG